MEKKYRAHDEVPQAHEKAHDEVSRVHEVSVKCEYKNVSVIYGQYSEGRFIAIPSRNVCVEADSPTDVLDNALKLASSAWINGTDAKIIAEAIKEHWEYIENKER